MDSQKSQLHIDPNYDDSGFFIQLGHTLLYHATAISKALQACGVKANITAISKQSKEVTRSAIMQKDEASYLISSLRSKHSGIRKVLTTYHSLMPVQLKRLFEFIEDHKIFNEGFHLMDLHDMLLGQPQKLVEIRNARRLACLFAALAKDKRINPNWKIIICQGEYFRGKIRKNKLTKAGLSAALFAGKKDVVFAKEVDYFINCVLKNPFQSYEFKRAF